MAKLGEANIGGRMVPAWLLDLTAEELDGLKWHSNQWINHNGVFVPGCVVNQRSGRVVPPGVAVYKSDFTTQAGTTDRYYTLTPPNSVSDGHYFFSFNGEIAYVKPKDVVHGYASSGYTIDRIDMLAPGALLITDNGINFKLNGSDYGYSLFRHYVDGRQYLNGKLCTLTVLTTQGLVSASGVLSSTIPIVVAYSPTSGSYVRAYSGDHVLLEWVVLSDSDPDIIAVKIELGNIQTLAYKESSGKWSIKDAPSYADMLMVCQGYYYDSRIAASGGVANGAYAAIANITTVHLVNNYRFPTVMRKKPSIKIYSLLGTEDCISYWASAADVSGVTASANTDTLGNTGFNSVWLSSEVVANTYAFHIVADAEIH